MAKTGGTNGSKLVCIRRENGAYLELKKTSATFNFALRRIHVRRYTYVNVSEQVPFCST